MDEIRRLVSGDEDLLRNVVIDGIYGLSRMLVLRGEVDEGVRIADIGVKLRNDWISWNNLGWAKGFSYNFTDALEAIDMSIELGGNYEVWKNRGIYLVYLKMLKEAIRSYNRALELKNDYWVYKRGK